MVNYNADYDKNDSVNFKVHKKRTAERNNSKVNWSEVEEYLKEGFSTEEVAKGFGIKESKIKNNYTDLEISNLKLSNLNFNYTSNGTNNYNAPFTGNVTGDTGYSQRKSLNDLANKSETIKPKTTKNTIKKYPKPKKETKTSLGNKRALEQRTQRNLEKRQKSANTAQRIANKQIETKANSINNYKSDSIRGMNRNSGTFVGPFQQGFEGNKNVARETIKKGLYDQSQRKEFVGPLPDNRNLKEKLFSTKIGSMFGKYLNNLSNSLPNERRDQVAAAMSGVKTKDTPVGKFTKFFGSSEIQGFNPITNSSMNIDYLSDMNEKSLNDWKNMHREESSKFRRNIGDNINPFNEGSVSEYDRQKAYLKQLEARRSEAGTSWEKNKISGEIATETKKFEGMERPTNFRERDVAQLEDVRKRLNDSSNNFKQFFNPVDKQELSMLESVEQELSERVRRYDAGYDSKYINNNEIKLPTSVSESFADLHAKRMDLYSQILDSGNSSDTRVLDNEIKKVNQEIVNRQGTNKIAASMTGGLSVNMDHPEYLKESHKPVYGTSGYGLGFKNAMAASRTEHLARFGHYMNPVGAGGASGTQALMESFGIMNKAQKIQASQARGFSKLTHNLVPIAATGLLISDMYHNQDAGQILEDFVSMGTGLQGWRIGSALGGGLTKAGGLSRFLGLGIGGLTGAATGYLAGAALIGGINDITSNDSSVRKFAKKLGTKELMVSSQDTRQSLTARQASLQKLARSGLNDRGLLLGNESNVLAGVL